MNSSKNFQNLKKTGYLKTFLPFKTKCCAYAKFQIDAYLKSELWILRNMHTIAMLMGSYLAATVQEMIAVISSCTTSPAGTGLSQPVGGKPEWSFRKWY